ncbi:hypothetical protein [Nocardioides ferulae]|uniref:hypothetical protein n=1 Tax=Nocardioides ferulae TaxID=2340821 RepID=UPI000EB23259|nr:hypothetical protein [Nocardioides ferulae]
MVAVAAGEFRRTLEQRRDQRTSWERTDEAFFAAGACHILAWACRSVHVAQRPEIVALRLPGARYAMHTYAVVGDWAFDFSGWNPEQSLIEANRQFEGEHRSERLVIGSTLEEFCAEHRHRAPHLFVHDPWPRAVAYVRRFAPVWRTGR